MAALNSPLRICLLALLGLGLAAPAAAWNMNKSIQVGDGMQTDGHSTVNGSITIGRSVTVDGSLETVNGTITIDDDSRARDAETVNGSIRIGNGVALDDVSSVNGSIRIGQNATVSGGVSVVNGKISAKHGSRIADNLSNVNGEIIIEGTEIGGNLSTVNGDVTLTDNAVLRGDLTIEKPGGWNWRKRQTRKPRLIIGPGAQVLGTIDLEREVELYIHDSATVGRITGEMSLDDAVRFSGQRP